MEDINLLINLLAVSSHKPAVWRFAVDTFGNSTEKTFLAQYLIRNNRINEFDFKGAPIDTVGYFKLRRTLKDMKLERKQQSGYYNIIMARCRLRAKRFERNASAGRIVMSVQPNWLKEFMQRPGKYKKADSPADHDMAQHPLNSDVGG